HPEFRDRRSSDPSRHVRRQTYELLVAVWRFGMGTTVRTRSTLCKAALGEFVDQGCLRQFEVATLYSHGIGTWDSNFPPNFERILLYPEHHEPRVPKVVRIGPVDERVAAHDRQCTRGDAILTLTRDRRVEGDLADAGEIRTNTLPVASTVRASGTPICAPVAPLATAMMFPFGETLRMTPE